MFRALWMTVWLGVAAAVGPTAAMAQSWYEPQRGDPERAQLMNALRPVVEWRLGAPVQFVIRDFRSNGTRAFAIVAPQRPGGGAINMRDTPLVQHFGDDATYYEEVGGTDVIAFLMRAGDQWAVVDHSIGATDVWFSVEPFCSEFKGIIDEFCPPQ